MRKLCCLDTIQLYTQYIGETNPNGSNQDGNNSDDGDSQRRVSEKFKLKWKSELQNKFLEAMDYLGQHSKYIISSLHLLLQQIKNQASVY